MKLWLKIAMVAAMTLAILVPLMMIFGVIQERQRYRDEAVADIAANIGQAQTLAGPVLVVPYTETMLRQVRDANGSSREEGYDALVSTIPLPALVGMIPDAPADVREAAGRLRALRRLLFVVRHGVIRHNDGSNRQIIRFQGPEHQ